MSKNQHPFANRRQDGDGWFRVCSRCQTDSDQLNTSFRLVHGCPLVRGDWMCSYCYDSHRDHCPVCKASVKVVS